MNLTSFGDLFKQSWELYKRKFKTLAILLALPFIANVISVLVSNNRFDSSKYGASTTSFSGAFSGLNPAMFVGLGLAALVVSIIVIVVSLWMQVASIYVVTSEQDRPNLGELLAKSLPLVLPVLLVTILAGLAVLGGLILLIVPGIIFGLWFAFSNFMVVLENKRGTEAMKASKQLAQGRLGAIFIRFLLLWLSFIGLGIVVGIITALFPHTLRDILSSGFSSFFFTPVGLIFTLMLYRDLKAHPEAGKAPAPAATPAT